MSRQGHQGSSMKILRKHRIWTRYKTLQDALKGNNSAWIYHLFKVFILPSALNLIKESRKKTLHGLQADLWQTSQAPGILQVHFNPSAPSQWYESTFFSWYLRYSIKVCYVLCEFCCTSVVFPACVSQPARIKEHRKTIYGSPKERKEYDHDRIHLSGTLPRRQRYHPLP